MVSGHRALSSDHFLHFLYFKSSDFANAPRFPFDWKNPLGYIIACILQLIIATYAFVLVSGTFCLIKDFPSLWINGLSYHISNEFRCFSIGSFCPWRISILSCVDQRFEANHTYYSRFYESWRKFGIHIEESLWIYFSTFEHKTVK